MVTVLGAVILAQGGPSPAQIQAAIRALLAGNNTWTGTNTFNNVVVDGSFTCPMCPETEPGGASGTLQYNDSGVFGGLTGSSVSGNDLTLPDALTVGGSVTTPVVNAAVDTPMISLVDMGSYDVIRVGGTVPWGGYVDFDFNGSQILPSTDIDLGSLDAPWGPSYFQQITFAGSNTPGLTFAPSDTVTQINISATNARLNGDGAFVHFETANGDGSDKDGGSIQFSLGAKTGSGTDGYIDIGSDADGYKLRLGRDGSVQLGDGVALRSDTTDAHTACFASVYDVNGTAYACGILGTNGNTPTLNISAPTGGTMGLTPTTLDLLADGVRLTGADGVLTLLGLGNGADENLTIDLDNAGANTIAFSSGTGVTTTAWPFNFDLGSSGVRLFAASGVFSQLGQSGQAESLSWDYAAVANTVGISSATGVTKIDYGTIITEGKFNSSDGTVGLTQTCAAAVVALTIKDGLVTAVTCP